MAGRAPFVAAIRGPVVLIVLGALFALDYSAGISFRKTWPILLIVAGLLHLFGRAGGGKLGEGQIGASQS
jgi:hypothetical protein